MSRTTDVGSIRHEEWWLEDGKDVEGAGRALPTLLASEGQTLEASATRDVGSKMSKMAKMLEVLERALPTLLASGDRR